jgi:hypothetical protein
MKLIPLTYLASFLILFGCKSSSTSSSSDSVSSTSSSQTVVAASVNSVNAAEVFNDFELNLNPKIVITGITATYFNDDNSQGFEIADLAGVRVDYNDVTDGLELKFSHNSFSDGNITITLTGFNDRGNEGYIDEFTVKKAEVVKSDGSKTEIPSVANTKKSNLGTKLKRSTSDRTQNDISPLDFSGSPTKGEWNKYMIGTAILATTAPGTPRKLTLVQFTTSTTGRYYDLAGYDNGDSGTFNYDYQQDGDKEGKLSMLFEWKQGDPDDVNYNATIQELDNIVLTFSDFYNGSYQYAAGTEKNLSTGAITNDTAPFEAGDFNTITDVDIYLNDQKITLSTN